MLEIDFSTIGHETPASTGKGKKKPKNTKPESVSNTQELVPIPALPVDKFKPLNLRALELCAKAMAVTVNSKEDDKAATDFGKEMSEAVKEIETLEAYYTDPHKKYNKGVANISKGAYEPLQKAIGYLRNAQLAWKKKLELAEREQEKLIREASQKLQAELKEKAEERGVEAPKVGAVKFPKRETVTRGDKGSSHVTGHWTYELLDITLVPREYLKQEIAPKAVNDKIAMGVRDKVDEETGEVLKHAIPGIRIYFSETVAYK